MTREEYLEHYHHYKDMSDEELRDTVSELYVKKFEDHDISVYEKHRIATRVLLENNKAERTGMIFHLGNLVR